MSKTPITKQELLVIANAEFAKEPGYRPYLVITDVEYLGTVLKFTIPTANSEEVNKILELNSLEFANRLGEKYELID